MERARGLGPVIKRHVATRIAAWPRCLTAALHHPAKGNRWYERLRSPLCTTSQIIPLYLQQRQQQPGGGEIILATLRGKRRAYGPKEDRLQVCAGIRYDL